MRTVSPTAFALSWSRTVLCRVPDVLLSCAFPSRGLPHLGSRTGAGRAAWRCCVTGKRTASGSRKPGREGATTEVVPLVTWSVF